MEEKLGDHINQQIIEKIAIHEARNIANQINIPFIIERSRGRLAPAYHLITNGDEYLVSINKGNILFEDVVD